MDLRSEESAPTAFKTHCRCDALLIVRWGLHGPLRTIGLAVLVATASACDGPASGIDVPTSVGFCGAPQCEIEMVHVARVSDSEDPGVLPYPVIWLQRSNSGRFFATQADGSGVVVFDPDGSLLATVGGRGQAPGEYQRARTLIPGSGDTVFVFDRGQSRVTVMGPDLEVHGILPAPYPPDLLLKDGSFVVASQISTRDAIGYPIHVVDRQGVVVRSFGTDQPQFRTDLRATLDRDVALSSDGTIWSVGAGSYVLERWNPSTGERVQRVEVGSDWFVESDRITFDERIRPRPIIEGIWEDTRGLVWVVIRDADLEWEPPARANEERALSVEDYDRLYDWIIEVVDPASAQVVARRRLGNVHWYRPPTSLLVSPADTDITTVAFDVWELILQPGG